MSEPKRSRVVTWSRPGQVMAAAASGRYRTGLDMLQAMVEGDLPRPPIAGLLGYDLLEVGDGLAIFGCTPGEQHYNPMDVVHGGVAATLLDSAVGCAVHTQLPVEVGYTTLELKVNYLRPMTSTTGPVRAIGRVIHCGRRTAVAEGRLEDTEGRTLAHATTTCLIFEGNR